MSPSESKLENTHEIIYQSQTVGVRGERSQGSAEDDEEQAQLLESSQIRLIASAIHESATAGASGLHLDPGVIEKTVTGEDISSIQVKTDEILKELRIVKRQNLVTQCLVGTMIVLTLGWQLSEVSLILMIKEGVTHPFRSFGNIFSGIIRNRSLKSCKDASEKDSPPLLPVEPSPPIPSFKLPEIPNPWKILQCSLSGNGK